MDYMRYRFCSSVRRMSEVLYKFLTYDIIKKIISGEVLVDEKSG